MSFSHEVRQPRESDRSPDSANERWGSVEVYVAVATDAQNKTRRLQAARFDGYLLISTNKAPQLGISLRCGMLYHSHASKSIGLRSPYLALSPRSSRTIASRIPAKNPGTISLGNFGQVITSIARIHPTNHQPVAGAWCRVVQMNQP